MINKKFLENNQNKSLVTTCCCQEEFFWVYRNLCFTSMPLPLTISPSIYIFQEKQKSRLLSQFEQKLFYEGFLIGRILEIIC